METKDDTHRIIEVGGTLAIDNRPAVEAAKAQFEDQPPFQYVTVSKTLIEQHLAA